MNNYKSRGDCIETHLVQTATQTELCGETNCGIISYGKNFSDFKLKCFYCKCTFPVSNYKDFVKHIQKSYRFSVDISEDNNKVANPIQIQNGQTFNDIKKNVAIAEKGSLYNQVFNNDMTEGVRIKQEHNPENEMFVNDTMDSVQIKKECAEEIIEPKKEHSSLADFAFERNSETEQHFTVNDILSSTIKGKKLFSVYNSKSYLNDKERNFLVNEIVNYYIAHKTEITLSKSALLVEEIIKLFPTESKFTYFYVNKQGLQRNKLHNIYYRHEAIQNDKEELEIPLKRKRRSKKQEREIAEFQRFLETTPFSSTATYEEKRYAFTDMKIMEMRKKNVQYQKKHKEKLKQKKLNEPKTAEKIEQQRANRAEINRKYYQKCKVLTKKKQNEMQEETIKQMKTNRAERNKRYYLKRKAEAQKRQLHQEEAEK